MLIGLGVIVAAGLFAFGAAYVMWWATSKSGLGSLIAGAIFVVRNRLRRDPDRG